MRRLFVTILSLLRFSNGVPLLATSAGLRTLARQCTGATLDLSASLGGALLLREYVLDARYIPSESMVPTFEVGDLLLLDKLTLRLRAPERGDIVCFRPPPEMIKLLPELGTIKNVCMIKRVVALPGDEVRVRGGRLHVNGCAQQEPYVARRMGYRLGTKRVPDGHVFVLGDNRDASCDSHVWGSLSQSLLIGEPLCTYWPPSCEGSLTRSLDISASCRSFASCLFQMRLAS